MAETYDLEIFQGSTYELYVTTKDSAGIPIDLTSYSVSGYIKDMYSKSLPLVDLNASKIAPYASGVVKLSIPATGTSALPVGLFFYDVEIYHPIGTVNKILRGKASVYPEVTY